LITKKKKPRGRGNKRHLLKEERKRRNGALLGGPAATAGAGKTRETQEAG